MHPMAVIIYSPYTARKESFISGSSYREIDVNIRLAGFALGAAACIAVQSVNAAEGPGTFTFRFAPPDGTKVVRDYRLVRERTAEGQPPQREEAESRTNGAFKKVADGYLHTAKVSMNTMRRNGQTITDPVTALLSTLELTY